MLRRYSGSTGFILNKFIKLKVLIFLVHFLTVTGKKKKSEENSSMIMKTKLQVFMRGQPNISTLGCYCYTNILTLKKKNDSIKHIVIT